MLNKGKRAISIMLCVLMMLSVMPFQEAHASEVENADEGQLDVSDSSIVEEETNGGSNTQEATNQENLAEENLAQENVPIGDDEKELEITTDEQINNNDKEVILNYFYIESPYLETPKEQNVVVSLGDGTENIVSVNLVYQKSDGSIMEWESSEKNGELFSFHRPFDETETGIYEFTDVRYMQGDIEKTISLREIGIEAQFGVNEVYEGYEGYEKGDGSVSLNEVEASVVTIDSNNLEDADEKVENTIAETSSIVGNIATKRSLTRSGNLVVVLDPGHGGSESGAVANNLIEKNLTLSIAKYCKAELEKYSGVTVYMTRSDDSYVGLGERVQRAKNWGADVFVSIHINSVDAASAYGAEVWYPNSSYNPSVHAEGKDLANRIQQELVALGLGNRGIKIRNSESGSTYPDGSIADYYSVIKDSKKNGFPGIIVEHAFLTNPSDAAKLQQESFLKELGIADATGIVKTYGLQKKASALLSVINANDFRGEFQLKVDTNLEEVSQVKASVWRSEEIGNVKSYEMQLQSDGKYYANVNKKDFEGMVGEFNANATIYYKNGTKVTNNVNYCMMDSEISTSLELSPDEKEAKAIINIDNPPKQMSSVSVAVWGAQDGQNDLRWYTAKQGASGAWEADISIRNHREAGEYYADTYITLMNGSQMCVQTKKFSVSYPTVQTTIGAYDADSGTFELVAHDIASPSGVESVRFPVWEASDQDGTIHWYDADRQPDGSYRAVVSISNHQYRMGTYRAHVYVTCGNGVEYNTNAGDNEVAAARASIEIGDKAGTQRTYHYSARNLGILGAKGVSVAVWGAQDGQNDLRWYTAKQGASGAWEADISIRNHREAGEYYADTYITLMNGSQMCVQTKKFSVSYPTVQTTIGAYDADSGTFELVAHDIASPSGVESVRFPVWYKNNQENTIYWYDAEKQADGTFKAIVNVRNHNYCVGSYQIHTYLTCGNGVEYNTNAGEIQIDNVVIRELYPIMGTPAVSVSQMISYFKQKMQPYPSDALRKGGASTIKEFCQIVYDESIAEGVKPEVVFAQAMLETGYLQFGHDVKIEQFNFCGMGATGGVPGNSFPDIRTGIRAQVQHLKCYATDKPLNNSNVDPRWWSELRNKAPYVEWLSIPNNPFGRGWAADPEYGVKLLNMISDIKKQ